MAKQSIHDILAQFREDKISNRELGDRFERLICRYLELDPTYKDRFSNVWMWNVNFQKRRHRRRRALISSPEERYFPGRILWHPVQVLPAGEHRLEK